MTSALQRRARLTLLGTRRQQSQGSTKPESARDLKAGTLSVAQPGVHNVLGPTALNRGHGCPRQNLVGRSVWCPVATRFPALA